MKSVIFNDHRKNCKKLKFLKNDFLNFWLDFSIKKLKKMKKKQKFFSATNRLADALAGRTGAEVFFSKFDLYTLKKNGCDERKKPYAIAFEI